MTMLEFFDRYWSIVAVAMGFVIWGIRLESKVKYLKEDFDEQKEDGKQKDLTIWEKFDNIQHTLNELLQATGRLEGKLDSHK